MERVPKNGIFVFYGVIFFSKVCLKKGIFPRDKRLQADDIMEIFPTVRLVSNHKEEALKRWRKRVGVMREEGNREFESFFLFS